MLDLFFTGFALIAALISFVCARSALQARDQARVEADELRRTRGRVMALEHSAEVLQSRVQTLTGKFYAMKRWQPESVSNDEELDPRPDDHPPKLTRDELRRQYLGPSARGE